MRYPVLSGVKSNNSLKPTLLNSGVVHTKDVHGGLHFLRMKRFTGSFALQVLITPHNLMHNPR